LLEEVVVDFGQQIAIGLSILMGVWFVVGAIINRKRGRTAYQWIQAGLKQLGKISEARWIGSTGTGARLLVGKAVKPFVLVEVIFLLESREIMPIWIFNRFRGKQDEMIVKANLRKIPIQEFEVAHKNDRRVKGFFDNPVEGQVPFERGPECSGFVIATRGNDDLKRLEGLQTLLSSYQDSIVQVSLQRQRPHLILRINLPPLMDEKSEKLFSDLNAWLSGSLAAE
jgi:hypothetical protein